MYLYGTRSASNLGAYRGSRPIRRTRRSLSGPPATTTDAQGMPVYIQVTDPSVIAMLQQTATSNGYDPAYVTQLINNGADAVQIQLALSNAPNGPQQALAVQQGIQETTDDTQIAQQALVNQSADPFNTYATAAAQAANSLTANLPTLPSIPTWVWWAAGGVGTLILFGVVKKAL
jgi:hypothetical protein